MVRKGEAAAERAPVIDATAIHFRLDVPKGVTTDAPSRNSRRPLNSPRRHRRHHPTPPSRVLMLDSRARTANSEARTLRRCACRVPPPPPPLGCRDADDDNTPPSHDARLPATKLSLATQAACVGIAVPPSPPTMPRSTTNNDMVLHAAHSQSSASAPGITPPPRAATLRRCRAPLLATSHT
ncbi:hypothetical protein HYPSUDRAFT_207434 [Hypholoma sublateritium FD-334 SS-4]|uniref:Uncharacterized protein n=1 Tax=Hypholoma sublateritium (strain FD-334 SS-4) TaxID=945553 RepID=A0A0D2N9X2_HYPSF|nr:hypothetical protein HYPSUDRAFT_207434 [Hypholoma sublateritium FD-334 SS-4]